MKTVKPITPKEAVNYKENNFPSEVIATFNELIVKNMKEKCAHIYQEEVITLILEKMSKNEKYKMIQKGDIFKNGWLDVEPLFRSLGWIVKYDKPGYDESYSAFFEFKIRE